MFSGTYPMIIWNVVKDMDGNEPLTLRVKISMIVRKNSPIEAQFPIKMRPKFDK